MIIEKRTYTFHPGKVQEFRELDEREGLALHPRYLPMVGYFTTEIGTLNQVITMWRYESMAEREELRARLYADPAWIAFGPKTTPYIQKMETEILRPTRFSPLQ